MVTEIEIVISPSIIVNCEITLAVLKNHASLENLDFEHSGHTGFASTANINDLDNRKVSKTDLYNGSKIKSYLIPDEFDEVMEFEKEVSGAGFIIATLATEIGSIVWCAATKAIAGDEFYRKFIVNKDGTREGLITIEPAKGKLYVGKTANNLFGWSGSNLLEISKSLALGETSTTAYAGNKGKANAQAIAELQSRTMEVVGYYDSADHQYDITVFPTSQTQIIMFAYKYSDYDVIRGGTIPLYNDNLIELAPAIGSQFLNVRTMISGDNTEIAIEQNGMSYFRLIIVETSL